MTQILNFVAIACGLLLYFAMLGSMVWATVFCKDDPDVRFGGFLIAVMLIGAGCIVAGALFP